MSDLLRASNVCFAYGERAVLRDVSLAMSPGRVVVLIGPNGSGKSTLLRVLLGQLRHTGEVRWDGRHVSEISRRELARTVAYLPQSPAGEASDTVAETLALGRTPYLRAFGLESARDAQVVADVARSLELTSLLGRRLGELSGGQRQRVFIGRALAQEPRALLLDEPSTFLDLRHQVDLLHLLRRIARERNLSILMASHELNLATSMADEVVALGDGRIVLSGAPADVLRSPALDVLYGTPLRRIEVEGDTIVVPWVSPEARR